MATIVLPLPLQKPRDKLNFIERAAMANIAKMERENISKIHSLQPF